MSDFQYILSPAQLTKHYEVIQFLTQHPNQEYTLAQLDTLLPHGVAVQRFPEEWFDMIADGACWHRSIELRRPAVAHSSPGSLPTEGSEADTLNDQHGALSVLEAGAAQAQSGAARRTRYVLSCVKSEIRTLDELRARLESPSTLLDADGCVALHTDQIIIAPELILRAQRTGLAYYFPDVYDKSEFRQFGVRDASASPSTAASAIGGGGSSGGGTRANAGQTTAALLDSFIDQEENNKGKLTSSNGGGSRDRIYIALPPGVRVQHQLLTRRGVPEQEDYCLPTKLYVGERLRLLFDNLVAVKKLKKKNELHVQLSMAGVKPSKSEKLTSGTANAAWPNVLSTEPPQPFRIRKETQAVRHSVAASSPTTVPVTPVFSPVAPTPSDDNSSNNNNRSNNLLSAATPMAPPASLLVSTTTKVEVEALYSCTLTLLLTVNGVENVLMMEVMEESAPMPGVLILRDRQLDNFALPLKDMLIDPIVNPPLESHYPFESILPASSPRTDSTAGKVELPTAQRDALQSGSWAEFVPLPWPQNPSPVVLSLREVTYPTQHTTVQAATRAVFSAQSLADEARLRQTKERLRRETERREGNQPGRKRRRMRYRDSMLLSNCHLLHFGFDFSIPFMRPPN